MIRTILSTFLLISFVKSTQTHPSNETCYQNSYSTRDYLREEEVSGIISPIPILFLSNPGSGSTHARLLLEFATGLFTGSIYTDANLVQLLPGDRFCGLRLAGRSFICIPFHSTLIQPHFHPHPHHLPLNHHFSHQVLSKRC